MLLREAGKPESFRPIGAPIIFVTHILMFYGFVVELPDMVKASASKEVTAYAHVLAHWTHQTIKRKNTKHYRHNTSIEKLSWRDSMVWPSRAHGCVSITPTPTMP